LTFSDTYVPLSGVDSAPAAEMCQNLFVLVSGGENVEDATKTNLLDPELMVMSLDVQFT